MTRKRETPSEILLSRLRYELGLKFSPSAKIKRTHHGRHQLAAGGWTWSVYDPDGRNNVGSFCRVTELFRARKLRACIGGRYDIEIWSEEDCVKPSERKERG